MILIIDYGMGNLASVANAFEFFGVKPIVSSDANLVEKADALVLPGVGAFGDAIKNLKALDLDCKVKDFVDKGKPLMGICLGMQLLFEKSYENGEWEGLGILKGQVLRFDVDLPVPHMGWNSVLVKKESDFLRGIDNNSYFYFDHSFYVRPDDDIVGLSCEYGITFAASVVKENVFGVQFHPEKSYKKGLKLIENFIKKNER